MKHDETKKNMDIGTVKVIQNTTLYLTKIIGIFGNSSTIYIKLQLCVVIKIGTLECTKK